MTTAYLRTYLMAPETWALWGGRVLKAAVILLLARLVLVYGGRLVEQALARAGRGSFFTMNDRRSKTLAPLLRSLLRYVVDVVAVLSVLGVFLPPATLQPILASAGVVGLAIGFGAQHLVRDIISGFFILYEDQFAVGDYVRTGQHAGTVEDIGLRITRLRDFSGELHVIPNGKIEAVTNLSRGRMRALVDVGVAYEEPLPHVLQVLRGVAGDVAREFPGVIVEGPEVLGVVDFRPSEMVVRLVAQTQPMEQWTVERALRHRILEAFEHEGIEIPYPRQVFLQSGGVQSGRAARPDRRQAAPADPGTGS